MAREKNEVRYFGTFSKHMLVADTNIMVAAILCKGFTRNLFFHPHLLLIAPDHTFLELKKHDEEFIEKLNICHDEYSIVLDLITSNLTIIPLEDYAPFTGDAKDASPDPEDWPFFAVAICKNCAIWSSEKRLKLQDKVIVWNTSEIAKKLSLL